MQYFYSAFNLGISSFLILPELVSQAESKKDVIIKARPLDLTELNQLGSEYSYSIKENEAQLYFPQVGTFEISGGEKINVNHLPDVEERLVRMPLLGASFAILLHQRNNFVLHSSAVSINNNAIAFLGDKGDGKSTMAAALTKRGHPLITDDIVAINVTDADYYFVLPGFPQLKLYPDSVIAALKDDPENLPELFANAEGKRSTKTKNFSAVSHPLKAIYVLSEGKEVKITKLSPHNAVRSLLANSYMARFHLNWLQTGIAASNLNYCVKIANEIPIYALERPRDLSFLEEIVQKIEEQQIT